MLNNVDFPAPFAPTIPKRSPGPISQVASSKIMRPVIVLRDAAEVSAMFSTLVAVFSSFFGAAFSKEFS